MLLGGANHQDALGNTALHYAVYVKLRHCFVSAIIRCTDVFLSIQRGSTREHVALVNLLLKHNADPNITNK
jgi:ankyrin repeat protein